MVSHVEEQFCAAENGKSLIRKYLWSYFFNEYTGLGMPTEKGQKSWDRVMLPPKGGEAQLLMEERPTIAKEAMASPLHSVSGNQQQVLMQAQQLVAALGLGGSTLHAGQMADAAAMHQQQVMQNAWLQQMQQAALGMPTFQMGPGCQQSGAGSSGMIKTPILELEEKGPCDFCGAPTHMQDQCTKYREWVRKGKQEVRAEIAAKIAARKAAAAARLEENPSPSPKKE